MRHVSVMTFTGSIGLVAIFVVDLADMFFLSLLGEVAIAAAIGYAGTILFFATSICIGISIATGALVSRALGAGDEKRAGTIATTSLLFMLVATIMIVVVALPLLPRFLTLLGAKGEAFDLALSYLQIVVVATPLLGLGMCSGALLRAVGDAKRAMYVTLSGGVVNAILDPIFIFGLDLGVDGAAYASVASRFTLVVLGYYGVVRVHQLLERPSTGEFFRHLPSLSKIAAPAIATNLATPAGNAYVTGAIANFGDGAVAGWAIVGRLIPVAFGVVFALSGAVGPIFGQNLGAQRYDRVADTFRASLIFCSAYVIVIWTALFLFQDVIASAFQVEGEAAAMVGLFCTVVAGAFLFNGALFVSNAAFNNLGRPLYSTAFNWGKATIGTIPFVYFGAQLGGAGGILVGQAMGAAVFGVLAGVMCSRFIYRVNATPPDVEKPAPVWRSAASPLSSGKSASV
ncbi:MAG: MATE family efflux transporter [Pseudomonadota bacterium]